METTIVLKKEELNIEFIEVINKLFKNYSKLQITISNSQDIETLNVESKEDYFFRLETAIKNVDLNKKITFSEAEFDEMTKGALK